MNAGAAMAGIDPHDDLRFMELALALGRRGLGLCGSRYGLLLDRHGRRKLQNFAARSYGFAAATGVFHLIHHSAWRTSRESADPERCAQLTCRGGAPTTRAQFRSKRRHNAAFRERFNA